MATDWNSCDCVPECPPLSLAGPVGPAGAAAVQPTNGTDGSNAFTYLAAAFAMPAVNAAATVAIADSKWIATNQLVYVEGGGTFQVLSTPTLTTVQLKNVGANGNASPGVSVPIYGKVVASGTPGPAGAAPVYPTTIAQGGSGQTTKDAAFDALAPTLAKGSLPVHNGTHNVNFPVGITTGMTLVVDGTTSTGLRWGQLNLANTAAVTGILPLARGGLGVGTLGQDEVLLSNTTGVKALKYNFTATVDPLVRDDNTAGYTLGSRWYNTTTQGEFVCFDNTTGAAVWLSTTVAGQMGMKQAVTNTNYTVPLGVNAVLVSAINKSIGLLPGASYGGAVITIKDTTGNSNPNIVINPSGSQIIEGTPSYTINVPNGSISIYWANGQWNRLGVQGRPLSFAEGGTGAHSFSDNRMVRVSGSSLTAYDPSVSIANAIAMPADGAAAGAADLAALKVTTESLRDGAADLRDKFNTLLSLLRTLNILS